MDLLLGHRIGQGLPGRFVDDTGRLDVIAFLEFDDRFLSAFAESSVDLDRESDPLQRELKTRYIEEVASRKQNEETMNQLQQEYQNLLKKYAEAENVIDDLRLGAKVSGRRVVPARYRWLYEIRGTLISESLVLLLNNPTIFYIPL